IALQHGLGEEQAHAVGQLDESTPHGGVQPDDAAVHRLMLKVLEVLRTALPEVMLDLALRAAKGLGERGVEALLTRRRGILAAAAADRHPAAVAELDDDIDHGLLPVPVLAVDDDASGNDAVLEVFDRRDVLV